MEVFKFYGVTPTKDAVPIAEKPLGKIEFGSDPESVERTVQYLLRQPFPEAPSVARGVENAEVCEEVVVESLVDGRPIRLRMAVYDEEIARYLPPQ